MFHMEFVMPKLWAVMQKYVDTRIPQIFINHVDLDPPFMVGVQFVQVPGLPIMIKQSTIICGCKLSHPTCQARSPAPFFASKQRRPTQCFSSHVHQDDPKEEPSVVGKTSLYRKCKYTCSTVSISTLQEEGDPEVIQSCRILVTTTMITARRPVTARRASILWPLL